MPLLPGTVRRWSSPWYLTISGVLLPKKEAPASVSLLPRVRVFELGFNHYYRSSILFSAVAIASAFSGLLAAAIVKMHGVGGRPGWAWLFILVSLTHPMRRAISHSRSGRSIHHRLRLRLFLPPA